MLYFRLEKRTRIHVEAKTLNHDIQMWTEIVCALHEVLPEIDNALSQGNVPLSKRQHQAFHVIQHTMLRISDYEAFFVSEEHGRMLIIVQEWYRDRYGEDMDKDEDGFTAAIRIHSTPFIMRVPKIFKVVADKPNQIWFGFPATIQDEENPINWIESQSIVERLSPSERVTLEADTRKTAELVRAIGFDLRDLQHVDSNEIAALAASAASDLQSSARQLCHRNEAGPRQSAWNTSQAMEKALKLFILRKGGRPQPNHDLRGQADVTQEQGCPVIHSSKLDLIPSGSDATNLRYGGELSLSEALAAYDAALEIIAMVVYEARPARQMNVRNARFLIKQPPFFEFDTDTFIEQLKAQKDLA